MSIRRVCTAMLCILALVGSARSAGAQSFEYAGERGPARWGTLEAAWKACSAGREQSPIDLSRTATARRDGKLPVEYSPARGRIFNNGHTIEVETEGRNVLSLDGDRFELVQFHFHAPSEHRIGGRSYEMEMHLVHRAEDGRLAVVGVFLTRGDSSKALAPVFDALPKEVGPKYELESAFNPADFLPRQQTHFRYAGSLTTPPCSEGVRWFVLEQPVMVSDEHLAQFLQLIRFNARPVQRRTK